MYCNRSCLWVCLCVGGSVTTITRNCVHRSSPNWVCIGKGIDQLYLIKFWSSRAPEGGSAAGDFFGFALLYSQRAVFNCVSCERFFIVHAFNRARAKLTIRKLLGLRRPYFFLSTLAHRLNFVVGPTLALLLDVDVRPSSEFRRWPNHYGCVGHS